MLNFPQQNASRCEAPHLRAPSMGQAGRASKASCSTPSSTMPRLAASTTSSSHRASTASMAYSGRPPAWKYEAVALRGGGPEWEGSKLTGWALALHAGVCTGCQSLCIYAWASVNAMNTTRGLATDDESDSSESHPLSRPGTKPMHCLIRAGFGNCFCRRR